MRVSPSVMPSRRILSDPKDRARSAAATVAIHLVIATALLTGFNLHRERQTADSLKTFDVAPPTPPPESAAGPARQDAPSPAGRRATPSPVVAPVARIPTAQPVAAAPMAGNGSAASAGAAPSGTGSGSGGTGEGGGDGGGGRTIGTEARLLSGNRGRVPRELLRMFGQDEGFAHLLLTISETGRVSGCSVMQGDREYGGRWRSVPDHAAAKPLVTSSRHRWPTD